MKSGLLFITLIVLTTSLTHEFHRLQHSWWCSKDKDSAPFQLIGSKGNIYIAHNPASGSYAWLKVGTHAPSTFISTWVDGKKQIKFLVDGFSYVAYLRPNTQVKTLVDGIVAAENMSRKYNGEVYLIPCASDEKKVEMIAKDGETGILSYLSTSGSSAQFGTQEYYSKTAGRSRECFTIKN